MPYYDIIGKGIKTNRTRHKRYLADNDDHVISLAKKDGTEVVSIEMVEAGPATEKQIKYAKDLGLTFPDDINVYEIGSLLDSELEDDSIAPKWLLEYVCLIEPSQIGLSLTKYVGLKGLVNFLYSKYFNDEHKDEMVRWFLYFVLRDRLDIDWDKPISEVYSDFSLGAVARKLIKNESVISSIKRYSASGMLRFGEYKDEDGYTSTGGSKRTAAYKAIMALLKEAGIIADGEKLTRQRSSVKNQNIESSSGCFSVALILVFVPVALYVSWKIST